MIAKLVLGRDGGFVSVKSLANEFEVSLKTIRRDMDFLREVGYVFEYDCATKAHWGIAPKERIL